MSGIRRLRRAWSKSFAGNLARVLAAADWDGFPARRRAAKKRGRLLGIGVANYVETPVGMPHERVAVNVSAERVDLIVGTQSSGQGHETSFRQVMADQLGVDGGLRLMRDQIRQIVESD